MYYQHFHTKEDIHSLCGGVFLLKAMISKKMKVTAVLLLLLIVTTMVSSLPSFSFSSQVLSIGSKGNDVIELQSRLGFIGYHKAKVDGVFGWVTRNSVRNFQAQFGMKVDGIAGYQTKEKLVHATRNWRSSPNPQRAPNVTSTKQYSSNDRR